MSEPVVLHAGEARVALAPAVGGSIAAFEWRGHPVLRPTPQFALAAQEVRETCCYPLVPYSNRIRNAHLHFGGRDHRLERNFGDHPHAIHGVGWQRSWIAAHVAATTARLDLDHAPNGSDARAWPWAFAASQHFALSSSDAGTTTLTMTLRIANRSAEPFPFGLGWHPYFVKGAQTRLRFAAAGAWLTDATVLPVRHVPIHAQWDFAGSREVCDLRIDNVFTGFAGEAVLDDVALPFTTHLEGDSASTYLVVYTQPQLDCIAIEPVTHLTDSFNRSDAGETANGTRVLAPGGQFSCTMRVIVRPR